MEDIITQFITRGNGSGGYKWLSVDYNRKECINKTPDGVGLGYQEKLPNGDKIAISKTFITDEMLKSGQKEGIPELEIEIRQYRILESQLLGLKEGC